MSIKDHLFRSRHQEFSQKITDAWRHASIFEKAISGIALLLLIVSSASLVYGVFLKLTIEVPIRTGSLDEGMIGSPRFINPVLAATQTDKDLSQLIYSGLARKENDGTIVPDLAESISVSENGQIYNVVIREDARFHDGSSVIAADVVYTVERIQDPNVRSPLLPLWADVDVEAKGERILSFTLPSPQPSFMHTLTTGILPRHLWEVSDPDAFVFHMRNTQPIGSGPFEFREARHASSGEIRSMLLRATDENTTPYLQSVHLSFYDSAYDLTQALKRGRVTSALIPASVELEDNKYAIHRFPSTRLFLLFFNLADEKFSEPSIRRGLAAITPIEEIVSKPARNKSLFIPSNLLRGGTGYDRVSLKKRDFDEDFTVSITTPDIVELVNDAHAISREWRANGVETDVRIVQPADLMNEVIRPRSYEVLLFGYTLKDPSDAYLFWHGSQVQDPGLNLSGYSSEITDELLSRLLTTSQNRQNDIRELNEVLSADMAAIPLYSQDYVYVTAKALKGVTEHQISDPSERFSEIEEWHTATRRTLIR